MINLFHDETGRKKFFTGITGKITFTLLALIVSFSNTGCGDDDKSVVPVTSDKEIVIIDLLLPQWADDTITEWASMVIEWTDESAPPMIIQKGLEEWWALGGTQQITKAQLREKCLLPYINGLWTDTEALLRTPEMIGQAAVDKLILPPEGMKGWPVYYPPMHGFVAEIISENNQGSGIDLVVKPLPAEKPIAGSTEGNKLYDNLGLLYLPNAYVVPGGTFNEMYGWDSFFIIIGLLNSAGYLYENMENDPLVWDAKNNTFRTATLDDVKILFNIAKGMADNHIYEISFYGGYILNANRSYYLTRSQPPLFIREVLAIYAFQKTYGKEIGLDYRETLSKYFGAVTPEFPAPVDFDEWMEREVIPAAVVYYNYWTHPELVYTSWDPHTSAASKKNPRVVTLEENGSASSAGEEKTLFQAYCFHTGGVGPAPEVVRSTQPQNRALYDDAALFFQEFPGENPIDPVTGNGMFWDKSSPYYAQLTEKFYAADRAIRASGYDLSGRYGAQGQHALDYAPVSLNTLLFQMGLDLKKLLEDYGCYGMTPAGIAQLISDIDSRTMQGKYVINNLMWAESGPNGFFSDVRIGKEGSAPEHTYPYGTMFYPLWADGLIEETERVEELLATASASQPISQDQVFSLKSGGETEMLWIYDNPGEICSISEPDMTLQCIKAINQSFIFPKSGMVHPENFGIPTSLVLTGNQWDNPFSWAPVQFFAARGLKNWDTKVNTDQLLYQVLTGWTGAAEAFFVKTGTLIEKYVSTDPLQDPRASKGYQEAQIGFGWTNGVYLEAFLMLQML